MERRTQCGSGRVAYKTFVRLETTDMKKLADCEIKTTLKRFILSEKWYNFIYFLKMPNCSVERR